MCISEGNIVLIVSGEAPLLEYQAILRSVQYSIESQEPDECASQRNISVSVYYVVIKINVQLHGIHLRTYCL